MALAGVPLHRAAVALLRQIADSEPLRPEELANGYVTRVPDPHDRRAQRIELTEAGREAIARVRDAGSRGMQFALADWTAEEVRGRGPTRGRPGGRPESTLR